MPFFAASEAPPRPESAKFPVFSQIAGNLAFRDEFAADSLQRRVGCELPGDGNQVDREAFVDQKPHDTAMVSRPRRVR